ncbi:hypothetical protein J6590_086100 [Homalodisca vitripennis]|nr:hypothetical protein J6590_086100 [Homalodisca vitripennis]
MEKEIDSMRGCPVGPLARNLAERQVCRWFWYQDTRGSRKDRGSALWHRMKQYRIEKERSEEQYGIKKELREEQYRIEKERREEQHGIKKELREEQYRIEKELREEQ